VNVRFTSDPTSRWRGDEGLQWVDSGSSIVVRRTAGIGRISDNPTTRRQPSRGWEFAGHTL